MCILPDRAHSLYQIPDDIRPLTGLAIGYLGNISDLPEKYQPRDLTPRVRKPLAEFVFETKWGNTARIASQR
ncbi:MAG: hypothetical protein ACJ8C4_01660 [Gemmataceae bacterium]